LAGELWRCKLDKNVLVVGLKGSNVGEVKNVSINWKNLVKFQPTKSTLDKLLQLHSTSGQVEHLHLILGNFKQLKSNLNNIQLLHLKLHTLRNIWANSNSIDHFWVTERSSLKLGYN